MTRKAKRNPKRKRIDWEKIELRYICGRESLTTICKRCKVAESSMFRASQRGNWNLKRKNYRRKVIGKSVEKKATAAAMDKSAFDNRASVIADRLLDHIEKTIEGEKHSGDIYVALHRLIEAKYRILGVPIHSKIEAKVEANVTTKVSAELSLQAMLTLIVIFFDSEFSGIYCDATKLLREKGKCYMPGDPATEHMLDKSEMRLYLDVMKARMKTRQEEDVAYAARRKAKAEKEAADAQKRG